LQNLLATAPGVIGAQSRRATAIFFRRFFFAAARSALELA
jgi:hypothetical protein